MVKTDELDKDPKIARDRATKNAAEGTPRNVPLATLNAVTDANAKTVLTTLVNALKDRGELTTS
jgi:hypothetical protein